MKIDRHFIDGIHRDPLKREFVGSILQIARASKAQVIAEGIELPEELAVLTEMGVDLVQGYLLGRPQEMGVRDYQQLLAKMLPAALVEQPTVGLNATLGQVMDLFDRYGDLKALDVLDTDGNRCGVIHRDALPALASSRSDVPAKRPVQPLHMAQASSG